MANLIELEKQEQSFTRFPEQIQNFFSQKEHTIYLYPDNIISDQEKNITHFNVTSAEQYYDYLESEISFWEENDPKNKFDEFVHISNYKNAKAQFNDALRHINYPSSIENFLKQSINSVSHRVLSSRTSLATKLLTYIDESSYFLSGFKAGMFVGSTSNISSNSDTLKGFYAAMAYQNVFDTYSLNAEEKICEFKTSVEEATKKYSILNELYTRAFIEQEKRLESITEKTNEHLIELDQKSEQHYKDADSRVAKLESIYREKLRLEEPAKYWETVDTTYCKAGTKWLSISAALAFLIVGGLIAFLLLAPNLFSDDYHWFDNLKNSAIITVIASIAIYMLRLTVKMATSSYHLSRDAKERNNLSYFYLALIEKGAVSDKERALILNALFSRSDTGLLKGDAAPSMPTNVSDIIEILKEK